MTPKSLLQIIYYICWFMSGTALGLNIIALEIGIWSLSTLMPLVLGIFAAVSAKLGIKVLEDT